MDIAIVDPAAAATAAVSGPPYWQWFHHTLVLMSKRVISERA